MAAGTDAKQIMIAQVLKSNMQLNEPKPKGTAQRVNQESKCCKLIPMLFIFILSRPGRAGPGSRQVRSGCGRAGAGRACSRPGLLLFR